MSNQPCEGELPQEVAHSRNLSIFLGNYCGSPRGGCQTASIDGGFRHNRLRDPHPETGNLCTLQLRAALVAGQPVIAMDQKDHDIGYNERVPSTDYRSV